MIAPSMPSIHLSLSPDRNFISGENPAKIKPGVCAARWDLLPSFSGGLAIISIAAPSCESLLRAVPVAGKLTLRFKVSN
jgi:hypothetical protein